MSNKSYFCLTVMWVLSLCTAVAFVAPAVHSAPETILSGTVSSEAEGPMEGVLVKAKRQGGTITITVVSDEHGHFGFPADKITPGQYDVSVRANGYEVPNHSTSVTVGADPAPIELKLKKVSPYVLVDQLTPAEVLESVPGSPRDIHAAEFCGTCHSFSRILKSTHDADEFMDVILRMRNHTPAASIMNPVMLPFHVPNHPNDEELAKFLASINLSSNPTWNFQFKTAPRPTGEATRVIYTEYDLPRRGAEPHDALMDSEGMVWYIDFADPVLGRLDPRTGETKEWTLPEMKPGFPGGSLGLTLDKEGNPWIARSFQGGIAKFDRKTEKITSYPIPKEFNNVYTRTTFIAFSPSDGKIWFDDTFNRRMYIFDPKTEKMIGYPAYPGWTFDPSTSESGTGPNGEKANQFMYGVAVNSQGIGYWGDIINTYVGEMDPETGKTHLYATPTPSSSPRRLHMDQNDVLWFAENNWRSRKIGMFDTKTKQFKEWGPASPYDTPYDVAPDKSGMVWAGGETSDSVTRLDPKTGKMVDYLLPNSNVNIRRVDVDNFTNPPSMIFGENHQAKIIIVQPLE
ncbi:MAG: carboxypeptidase regulatory-like domain-containing protein [Candidatus Acidiferrales bacterium]